MQVSNQLQSGSLRRVPMYHACSALFRSQIRSQLVAKIPLADNALTHDGQDIPRG